MQDLGYELPRITIPRNRVNKGMKKGRTCQTLLLLLVAESLLPLAQPLGGDSLLLILDAYASVLRPTLFAAERLFVSDRSAAMSLLYYSCAKASRSCFSCSSGRLVEMISKSYAFSSSTTLSTAVAPLVSANRAEVPSVTFSRTCLIKSSSMPTSDIAPDIPPIAAPRKGTKKIIPIRKPQNAPQPALPPCNSRVLGFLLPWGQLTIAASSRVINSRSCMPWRATMTLSAP